MALRGRHAYPYFTDKETEAERGKMTRPSHATKLRSRDSNPGPPNSNSELSPQRQVVRGLVPNSATLMKARIFPHIRRALQRRHIGQVAHPPILCTFPIATGIVCLTCRVWALLWGKSGRRALGPWISNITIAWELIKNAESQACLPSQSGHLNMIPSASQAQ